MSGPQVGFFCAACREYGVYALPPSGGAGLCGCGHRNPSTPSPSLLAAGPVDRCPQCGNLYFYTRKDFPQQLGCAAVSATIALSTVAYALWDVPAAIAVLALASLADFALYHRLSEVTVCYRCHAELRGFAPNPEHGPFDMHRAEEYDV
ncbi:MAG TPA: hypothetical protein VIE88_09825 [Vicinamibacteria bacterium]|jgi:hypothetical protein